MGGRLKSRDETMLYYSSEGFELLSVYEELCLSVHPERGVNINTARTGQIKDEQFMTNVFSSFGSFNSSGLLHFSGASSFLFCVLCIYILPLSGVVTVTEH